MAPPRLSPATKRLRGTFEASRDAPIITGRYRLTEPVAPPDGADKETQREWALHMSLAIAAGTISVTDLRSFAALTEAAVLSARAYRAALKSGPIVQSERGCKTAPQWSAWIAASGVYRQWCMQFGLTPMSGRMMPSLPAPKTATKLAVVA
jgi:hypothetical protein